MVMHLNLLRAFATGGYAAMQRVTHWNLDFMEHSEQGDRYISYSNSLIRYTIYLAWFLGLFKVLRNFLKLF